MLKFYFNSSRIAIIFLLLLSTFCQFTLAQGTGSVRGKITDKSTGEELIGANVIIEGTSLGAAADIYGNYVIRNAPSGQQKLIVSYLGYNSITFNINIPQNATLELNVELEPRVIEGEEVVITGQAQGQLAAINQQLSSNTIANVVSKDRIKELPDVNAAESIGRLPGVSNSEIRGRSYQD